MVALVILKFKKIGVLKRRKESSGNPSEIQRSPIETSQWRANMHENESVAFLANSHERPDDR
jgi:hypothetical protein